MKTNKNKKRKNAKSDINQKIVRDFVKIMDEIKPYLPQKQIDREYSTAGKWEICSIH